MLFVFFFFKKANDVSLLEKKKKKRKNLHFVHFIVKKFLSSLPSAQLFERSLSNGGLLDLQETLELLLVLIHQKAVLPLTFAQFDGTVANIFA